MALSHNDVFNMLVVQDGSVVVSFSAEHSLTSIEPVRDTVTQRIAANTKPAQKLSKTLDSLALQLERVQQSITTLFETYGAMVSTTPRQRTSASFNARKSMLEAMPAKVLKDFAKAYIPNELDDYIMPDDASALITRLLDVLSEAAKKEGIAASAK